MAQTFFCTTVPLVNGKLTDKHDLLYVPVNPCKLGQKTVGLAGFTPTEAFRNRYKSFSNRETPVEPLALFVIDKGIVAGKIDDAVRKLIHRKFRAKLISFDAFYGGYRKSGINTESLINFVPDRDVDTLAEIVREFVGLTPQHDMRESRSPRFSQADTIREGVDKLTEYKKLLLAVWTGGGKTYMTAEIIARVITGGGIVLVTSPIADTIQGIVSTFNDYHVGDNRARIIKCYDAKALETTTIEDLRRRADSGELIIIALTVQDVRFNDKSGGTLRLKYDALRGHLDLIWRDEAHLQYGADRTAVCINELSAPLTIDTTATPYSVLDKHDPMAVVSRTLIWALANRPNMPESERIPSLSIDAISDAFLRLDNTNVRTAVYSDIEGYDPRKLFVRTNGVFDHQKAIEDTFWACCEDPRSRQKNPLSVINDTALCSVSKRCGMVVCPEGINGDSAVDYLPALAGTLNDSRRFTTYFIDAYALEKETKNYAKRNGNKENIGDYVKELLRRHPRVVILTHGKFRTGSDIPALGYIILFDKIESLASFEQLLGRVMRVYKDKTSVKLYCMQPGMSVRVLLAQMQRAQNTFDGETQKYSVHDCIPLVEYRGGNFKAVSVEEILEAERKYAVDTLTGHLSNTKLTEIVVNLIAKLDLPTLTANYKAGKSKPISDKNGGAKVKSRIESSSTSSTSDRQSNGRRGTPLEEFVKMLQTLDHELRFISRITDVYDIDVLLNDPMLPKIFPDLQAASITINTSSELRDFFQSRMEHFKSAYASHTNPLEYLDHISVNTDYKVKSGIVYTPIDLARQLIPNAVDPKRIAVVNATNGTVALAARERYPNAIIECYELTDFYNSWLSKLGFVVKDFWTEMTGKFDVIVGNPPYQDSAKGRGSRWPLWMQVTKKCLSLLNDKGYLALVTPSSWLAPNEAFNLLSQHDMRHVDLTVGKYFNVGSTFSAWMLCKQSASGATTFVTKNGTEITPLSEFSFLPTDVNALTLRLMRKFYVTPKVKLTVTYNCENHNQKKNWQDTKSVTRHYRVFHTNLDFKWSNVRNSNYNLKKVVMSLSGYQVPHYLPNCGTSDLACWIDVRNETEGKRLVNILSSKLYQVMMNLCKYSGFMSLKVLNALPALNLSREWTDEQLYKHFKLTKEEIAYIEEHAK